MNGVEMSLMEVHIVPLLGDLTDGDYCTTPRQEAGLCVSVENCEFVKRIFQTFGHNNRDVNNYLNRLTCGFSGRIPLVCCPGVSNSSRGTTSETTTEKKTTLASTANTPLATSTRRITETGRNFQTTAASETSMTANEMRSSGRNMNGTTRFLRPPDCGKTTFTGGYRIVGGVPAKPGNFPWMVALGYKNRKNPNLPKWLCGGTLISNKHVLTAAHCVETTEELYTVRVGDLDLYSDDDGANPVEVLVASTKIHEDYNPRVSYTNDIAILTLAKEVNSPSLSPICLPVDEPLRSNRFVRYYPYVAGWGSQEFRGPSSTSLLVANLMVVDNDKCAKSFSEFDKVTIDDRALCAGFPQGGKDACKGDSGGPLMHGVPEGRALRFYIIGIVSFGYNCAQPGYPGVYTRVSHFINWIENNII
ncbi:venom protease isoform X2 [Agrilus planipennis]|uniref:CLIP domain-containing serine protease n=1 Tax=Agrilus planipennis TaxID=224129 RepID=A0A1W4WNW1_AGRPL|nr:venom protease isoform X2 [Agrilus planipennis]